MISEKSYILFKSVRVLHQSENLEEIISKNKNNYLTIISYKDLGLEKRGFSLVHKKVINIYLEGSTEEILSRFNRRTEQEVKKTYSIPGLEFKIDDSNFDETYKLYCEFEIAQGRKPWKKESFDGTKQFNAYYQGKLVASVPCYDIFPHLQVRAIFSKRLTTDDKELQKIIGDATRRLIFEACKYGKERNYEFVGLGSVNFSTTQKSNVAQFKMFFGGKMEDEYTYVYRSPLFTFFQKIKSAIRKVF